MKVYDLIISFFSFQADHRAKQRQKTVIDREKWVRRHTNSIIASSNCEWQLLSDQQISLNSLLRYRLFSERTWSTTINAQQKAEETRNLYLRVNKISTSMTNKEAKRGDDDGRNKWRHNERNGNFPDWTIKTEQRDICGAQSTRR